MESRYTAPPKRLHPRLFTPDGRARPALARIVPILEEAIRPKQAHILVFGSQAMGTFRTEEDMQKLDALRKRKFTGVTPEEKRFLMGLFDSSAADMEYALGVSRGLLTGEDDTAYLRSMAWLPEKLLDGKTSDLDIHVLLASRAEVPDIMRRAQHVKERLETEVHAALGMGLDMLVNSYRIRGTAFEIETNEWLEFEPPVWTFSSL
ncbi:MAG TPA: hypothetical protein VJH24_03880 [Candidatus Bilamarchaeaceae archaeon]|nr:hypothetical protein [Candidatus Bilamarchaeaceae archaeon]